MAYFCVHVYVRMWVSYALTSPEIDGLEFPTRFEEALKQQPTTLCALQLISHLTRSTSLGECSCRQNLPQMEDPGHVTVTSHEETSIAHAPCPAIHDGAQTAALHIIQHLKPILSSQLRAASSSLREMAGTELGSLSNAVVRQVSGRKLWCGCQMPHLLHPGAYDSIWITLCVLNPFWLKDASLIFNKIARLLHARGLYLTPTQN